MATLVQPPRMRIRCAVCDKPVDHWEMDYSPWLQSRRIEVRCHGQTDTMELGDWDLEEMGAEAAEAINSGRIEGVAFVTKKLSETKLIAS